MFLFRPFALQVQQARCGAIGHTFLYFLDAPGGGSWIVATLLGSSFSGPRRVHYTARYDVRHPNDIPMAQWRTGSDARPVLIQTWCGSNQRGLRWQDLQRLRAKMARAMRSAAAAALDARSDDENAGHVATSWPLWARATMGAAVAVAAVLFAQRKQAISGRASRAGGSGGARNGAFAYQGIAGDDGDFEFEPMRMVETRTDGDLVPL